MQEGQGRIAPAEPMAGSVAAQAQEKEEAAQQQAEEQESLATQQQKQQQDILRQQQEFAKAELEHQTAMADQRVQAFAEQAKTLDQRNKTLEKTFNQLQTEKFKAQAEAEAAKAQINNIQQLHDAKAKLGERNLAPALSAQLKRLQSRMSKLGALQAPPLDPRNPYNPYQSPVPQPLKPDTTNPYTPNQSPVPHPAAWNGQRPKYTGTAGPNATVDQRRRAAQSNAVNNSQMQAARAAGVGADWTNKNYLRDVWRQGTNFQIDPNKDTGLTRLGKTSLNKIMNWGMTPVTWSGDAIKNLGVEFMDNTAKYNKDMAEGWNRADRGAQNLHRGIWNAGNALAGYLTSADPTAAQKQWEIAKGQLGGKAWGDMGGGLGQTAAGLGGLALNSSAVPLSATPAGAAFTGGYAALNHAGLLGDGTSSPSVADSWDGKADSLPGASTDAASPTAGNSATGPAPWGLGSATSLQNNGYMYPGLFNNSQYNLGNQGYGIPLLDVFRQALLPSLLGAPNHAAFEGSYPHAPGSYGNVYSSLADDMLVRYPINR